MKKIRAGIIGGAGYTGGELIRLLINHPGVSISFVHSKSHADQPLHQVHQDISDDEIFFSGEIRKDIDVLFLCVGHGDSKKFLAENIISPEIKIIDLSQDFRLSEHSIFSNRTFVYGLPECNRELIKDASNVANPGCFATAIILGLLPVAKNFWLQEVFTTGITGSTGAGQGHSDTSHFSWRENNIQAYKSLKHQHIDEIGETLNGTSGDSKKDFIHFVPWRGNFTRGIFVSSQLKCINTLPDMYEVYEKFYRGHPFVKIKREPIFLKQVINTNFCFISLEMEGEILVVHSVIDNLLKGASGQAVQNMNLMFGLDEQEGLSLKASYF